MICRTVGRYISKFSGVASSAKHCSRTERSSSGTFNSSLPCQSTIGVYGILDWIGYVRHVYVECGKCSNSSIKVISQSHIHVANLPLVYLGRTPSCEGLQKLLDGHQQPGHCRFYRRLPVRDKILGRFRCENAIRVGLTFALEVELEVLPRADAMEDTD